MPFSPDFDECNNRSDEPVYKELTHTQSLLKNNINFKPSDSNNSNNTNQKE